MPLAIDWGPYTTAAAGVVVIVIVLFAIMAAKFYLRTESDVALVRTGAGGLKVILDGGLFALPVLHEVARISLSTMQLAVLRSGKAALITKDRYRVDVSAEFFIKVQPIEGDVKAASRSLGGRAMSAEAVKELVEAKLVGALRTVAATMGLDALHERRDEFADSVQKNLADDLRDNGLTLESVTITDLDQTDMEELDPNNVFDAEGLKKIAQQTEERRKEKNLIQREAEAEIARQNREARERILEEEEREEEAEAVKLRNVEVVQAEKEAETQRFRYEQDESVQKREIEKDRQVALADVERDQRVEEAQLQKETELIEKRQAMEETEIGKQLAVEIAEKDRDIGVIEKEKEREEREAEKLASVAERERAEQAVITVEKTEEAKRRKEVSIIQQEAESEQDKIRQEIAADAEAYEVNKAAEAEQQAAEKRAAALERMAEADLAEAKAEAEGKRLLIEARNLIERDVLVQEASLAFIEKTPELVREAMKPSEKISDIKVLNVQGMGGLASNGAGADGSSTAGGVVSSFLQAGAALPMLREVLKFAGVDADDRDLTELAQEAAANVPGLQDLSEQIPESLRRRTPADRAEPASPPVEDEG